MRVLIVADGAETIVTLTARIVTEFNANVTVVNTLGEARALVATEAFDIVIASQDLPDGVGLSLLQEHNAAFDAPMVLLERDLDAHRIMAAFREGVVDVFPQPIDQERLMRVIGEAVRGRHDREDDPATTEPTRGTSTQLVQDQRELRQRVDMICRDLVNAYQGLALKVVAMDNVT